MLAEIARHPLTILIWTSIVMMGVPFLTIHLNKKVSTESEQEAELDEKVDKEDCRDFRKRIGKETSTQTRHYEEVKNDVADIKEDMAYLRGKAEGSL